MEQGPCLQAWWQNHIFYRTQSALLWRNPGWQVLQREGYAGDCVAGGGRFWFAYLHSNIISTDMGLCAPQECSSEEVSWVIFPEQHKGFFDSAPRVQFAVQTREYHDIQGAFPQASIQVLVGFACAVAFSIIGLAVIVGTYLRSGDGSKLNGLHRSWCLRFTSWSPLQVLATICLVIREVTLHTRWSKYDWHEARSFFFKFARHLGKVDKILPVVRMLELTSHVSDQCRQESHSSWRQRLKSAVFLIALHVAKLALFSLFWIGVAQAVQPVLSTNLFSRDAWLRPGWSNALTFCANAGLKDILLPFSPDNMLGVDKEIMCPHLEPLYSEFHLLTMLTPLLLAASATGSERTGIIILGVAWLVKSYGGAGSWSLSLPHFTEAMSFSFGTLLAVHSARLPTRRYWLFNFVLVTLLGTAASAFPNFAAVGSAIRLPVCLMGGRLLLKQARLQCGISLPWFGAAGAVPAVPLVLFAVEGYAEPHAKWLTAYDFLLRAVALAASCWALGAFTEVAWHGLAFSVSETPRLLGWAISACCSGKWDAPGRMWQSAIGKLGGSVRLSLRDSEGKEYCVCQAHTAVVLIGLLAVPAFLAWAAVEYMRS